MKNMKAYYKMKAFTERRKEMKRKYIANLDDGHDYSSIEFYSDHRAGSRANKLDCQMEITRKYGFRRAKSLIIKDISLYE